MKYSIASASGFLFHGDKLREPREPSVWGLDMIPNPDSVPLSVLSYPTGKRDEINLAAYDPPELTLSPIEGAHPVLVPLLDHSFEILIGNRLGVYYGFIYSFQEVRDHMVKFTFSEGESERTFVATGAHFKEMEYKDYKLVGNWSLGSQDGKIRVEMEVTYDDDYYNVELEGVFDPEENSLRGTAVMLIGTGEFVFKRDPAFVRFYPVPSVITPRKRWEFVTTAVLDRVRQQAWSPRRIFKRIEDRKRFMELIIQRHHGKMPTVDEFNELYGLFYRLDEADFQFCASLIKIHLGRTALFA